ncbi:MAG TPA: recombination mediator RecR [Candidatus Sulfotelmatobacter sp.]|nr:recombination mediator RecR [Candidatus Sulfotelmatobacter sp.]
MVALAAPLARVIDELVRLPGIGPKTAQRLALHLLKVSREEAAGLAEAILALKDKTRTCALCYNVGEEDLCPVCRDPRRDPAVVCVVEEPSDLIAIERTREFHGVYHVLGGSLSPLEGRGPDRIRGQELLARVADGAAREVILATNPTVEGEATALYLQRLLKPTAVRVTRLARGIPVGGALQYADEVTLSRALEGRRELA